MVTAPLKREAHFLLTGLGGSMGLTEPQSALSHLPLPLMVVVSGLPLRADWMVMAAVYALSPEKV